MANKIVIDNHTFFSHIESAIKNGDSVEIVRKGKSMLPALQENKDKVVLSPLSKHELYIGAVVLFQINGKYILHRLININDTTFTFQGDNLRTTKEYASASDMIAIVEYIIKSNGDTINCFETDYIQKAKKIVLRLRFRNKCRLLLKSIIEIFINK